MAPEIETGHFEFALSTALEWQERHRHLSHYQASWTRQYKKDGSRNKIARGVGCDCDEVNKWGGEVNAIVLKKELESEICTIRTSRSQHSDLGDFSGTASVNEHDRLRILKPQHHAMIEMWTLHTLNLRGTTRSFGCNLDAMGSREKPVLRHVAVLKETPLPPQPPS
ncbi:hypothetical protein WG66_004347, partial [Moniliophthora roreri]